MRCSRRSTGSRRGSASQRFLFGEQLTEADWRLFTTLIRFDAVYFGHFKCNLREIRDYPALSRYLGELYHWPGVAETVDFFHIKHHYYASHRASTRPESCRWGQRSTCRFDRRYFFIFRALPSNVVTIACIYPSCVM